MMGWQPIETAPRDGQEVDIWIVPPSRREPGDYPIYAGACAQRIPDARPCWFHAWQDATGRTVTGRRFYDDGKQCLDPDDTSDRATRATHWRYAPAPPTGAPALEPLAQTAPPVPQADDMTGEG